MCLIKINMNDSKSTSIDVVLMSSLLIFTQIFANHSGVFISNFEHILNSAIYDT